MPDDDSALVAFMPSGQRGRVEAGTTLLDAARQVGLDIESICGGRQTCGRCQITVEEGAFAKHGIVSSADRVTAPGAKEAELLRRRGLDGRRLSCAARVTGDVLVGVPADSQARKQVIRKSATDRVIAVDPTVRQVYVEVAEASLTDQRGDAQRLAAALADQWRLYDLGIDRTVLQGLQRALRNGRWAVTVTLWDDREILDVRPGYHEGAYGLAVDVGSTTVAAHLCDLRTGAVLATESMANPQVVHGEDLMSRVAYAMTHDDGLERMRRAIIDGVCQLAAGAAATAGIGTDQIYEAVVVGNTVMHHILLGIDPVELGGAPFALATQDPIDCKARDLGLV
ncbi:MAG: 2Fe-2S iron-sulfur cluster-binding protein, partial [Actinomycetota bacterium]|nr:2Fe-2S iron-sulfur cluster-binding protein [Actinomycetota bacterium]